ncbi:MAG: hypothetical protein KJ601_06885 [Nanoarchaeota archaeon]|nr:hypothetical protein [Nanoarchaeota archaeon]MBU1704068.1 hypothetical protein [Nanoarchaeota archaeon]
MPEESNQPIANPQPAKPKLSETELKIQAIKNILELGENGIGLETYDSKPAPAANPAPKHNSAQPSPTPPKPANPPKAPAQNKPAAPGHKFNLKQLNPLLILTVVALVFLVIFSSAKNFNINSNAVAEPEQNSIAQVNRVNESLISELEKDIEEKVDVAMNKDSDNIANDVIGFFKRKLSGSPAEEPKDDSEDPGQVGDDLDQEEETLEESVHETEVHIEEPHPANTTAPADIDVQEITGTLIKKVSSLIKI